MPCITYDSEYDRKPNNKNIQHKFEDLKKHSDKVTRLLCKVMDKLEKSGSCTSSDDFYMLITDITYDPELIEWHQKHKEADNQAKESLKTSGLSKLTEEEKIALGLLPQK